MEEKHPPVLAPNLALLLVCKDIHEEISYLAWAVMRKRFFDRQLFICASQARFGPAMPFNYLNTVELAFTNKEFFAFFGVEVDPQFLLIAANSSGPTLQNLTGIKGLQLRFRTIGDGYTTSPWGHLAHKLSLARYGAYAYVCCQRTMVD
jgi:hypothetical protein